MVVVWWLRPTLVFSLAKAEQYTDPKSNQTVVWWWSGGGVVVWFTLPMIEPPQSALFKSGLNWVVAIVLVTIITHA